jgi:hypothetical protein
VAVCIYAHLVQEGYYVVVSIAEPSSAIHKHAAPSMEEKGREGGREKEREEGREVLVGVRDGRSKRG